MNKKIVLFGGTFDPPHVEHVHIAMACSEYIRPEKFIVMPTKIPPHKKTFYPAPEKDRLEMCRIAFSDIPDVEISADEILSDGPSYSYITVERLKSKYPDRDIYFLMGTDMLATFDEWKFPERILKSCTPVLCGREGDGHPTNETADDFRKKFGVSIPIVNYFGKDVSSTEIKTSHMLGLDVSSLIPGGVYGYIVKNGLYAPDNIFSFVSSNLKKSRLEHTEGVILSAALLAKKLHFDTVKAIVAAAVHDCAKYLDAANYPEYREDKDVPIPVRHQFFGAFIAEKVLGITDGEILDAVRYHTSGRPEMSTLEKIVYVADMTERTRDYPELAYLRKTVEEDFETGFRECLRLAIEFVEKSGRPVYKLSYEALNYYKNRG